MAKTIYRYEHRSKKKKRKIILKKIYSFVSYIVLEYDRFGRTIEMWENMEILHLSQQKEEGII